MSENTNTPAIPSAVDVVDADQGPLFTADELAVIETISNGGTVDGVDVSKLDHSVMVGLHKALQSTATAITDVAGFLGTALQLRTWQRVSKSDGSPYTSELDFVDTQIHAHPVVAQILGGTEVRRAVTAAITGITDDKGNRVSDRRMAALLGVKKSTVNADRNAAEGGTEGGTEGSDRGPQTGGQTVSNPTAVKRHLTGFGAAGTRVRDDAHLMDAEQLLVTISEAKDTLSVALATLRLNHPEVELPEWVTLGWDTMMSQVDAADRKLRSGAEGTTAGGPNHPPVAPLKGAPVDPTAAAVTPATAAARRAAKGKATA